MPYDDRGTVVWRLIPAIAHAQTGHELRTLLSQYTHVTWRGGATIFSVRRADWETIDKAENDIIVLPDADDIGYDKAGNVIPDFLDKARKVEVFHGRGLGLN